MNTLDEALQALLLVRVVLHRVRVEPERERERRVPIGTANHTNACSHDGVGFAVIDPRGPPRILRRAMSQENVDLTRQAYAAWNTGELDWLLDHMTEDFEFQPGLGFSDLNTVFRGKEGWRQFAETWREAWEEITVRVERIEDLDDRIVALLTFDGRGRGSGVEVSLRVGHVATVREGRLSKLVSIPSWDEALEAVGLSE